MGKDFLDNFMDIRYILYDLQNLLVKQLPDCT